MNLTITNNMIIKFITGGNEYTLEKMMLNENGNDYVVYESRDYSQEYFTIESLEDANTVTFTKNNANSPANTFYYSTDGTSWTSSSDTTSWSLNTGDKLLIKATADRWGDATSADAFTSKYWRFSSTKTYNAYGNIMSMLFGDNFAGQTTLTTNNRSAFNNFFSSSKIVDASNLIIPATNITDFCCFQMFSGCSSLIAAPELPATTLAQCCYEAMFSGCSSLTTAPALPAPTLANDCYYNMFRNCSSLNYIKCLATDISASGSRDYWVYNVAASGTFVKDASMNGWPTGVSGIPSGWTVDNVITDYSKEYFTIESLKDGSTVTLTKSTSAPSVTFYYSVDDGSTWSSFSSTTSWNLNSGKKIKFKATANTLANSNGYYYFNSTEAYKVYGNIMSLLYGDNFIGQTTLNGTHCFRSLFHVSRTLVDASNLVMPATTLTNICYNQMFYECTALKYAPASIPATTLASNCCYRMFYKCSSLITAPELPATTLASNCYQYMFGGCTSLTTAPELPATTLTNYCYASMFWNCTSLTTAPVLPATTLTSNCYQYMFQNCSNLNYIKCLATSISASNCLNMWVTGVSASGKFVKDSSMSSWSTGTSGIPSGWTVEDAA